jgi:transposase-like protein
LAKISSAGLRAPGPFEGLNVNFCKNPKCANFGVPETPHRVKAAPGATPQPGDYTLTAAGKGKPQLKCLLCGEIMPMRGNQGIVEELTRVMAYLNGTEDAACQNEACSLFTVPLSLAGSQYVQRGKTAAGTQRYRCNACKKTFSGAGKSTKKHRMPHKNRDVFALLISKMPIRRMAWYTGLDRQSLYGKIDFVHRQCVAFSGERERGLLDGSLELPKLYLSTDRQTLAVNWSNRKDRRNVALQAIATADLESGFVLGMDLNFDSSLSLDEVQAEAVANGDVALPQAYRRYARLWLKTDYAAAVDESAARKAATAKLRYAYNEDALGAAIETSYADAGAREDVEEVVIKEKWQKLPTEGVEVRDQYTVYAHFLMLERLLRAAPKVRCYLDQDSGFRAAFMAAFHRQIRERRADAWFVKVMKESTIDQKDAAVSKARKRFNAAAEANPGRSKAEVELLMTLEEMDRMAPVGKWDDRWLTHPVPSKAEPDKRVCWLTDIDETPAEPSALEEHRWHAAHLYIKGSLHAVDRFFMQERRRLSLAERPYATASSDRRMWHGYSAYQPQNLAKVLTIFKVAYNYCLPDVKGKTPAMKLGLAKGVVALEDILYFSN